MLKAGTAVGRAILFDGLLLLGGFACLDRQAELAALMIDVGDHRIDFLADGETVRALLGTVTAEIGAADEARQRSPTSPRCHCRSGGDRTGHDLAFTAVHLACEGIIGSCLMPSEMRSLSISTSRIFARRNRP